MSGWKQWSKQAATSSFLDKKPPKSLEQQGLEGSTAVGKDEVGSSNLPSSSIKNYRYRCVWRKARRINRFRAFLSPDFFF
jgi:hypothetical protein